jgi:hypothetical protein
MACEPEAPPPSLGHSRPYLATPTIHARFPKNGFVPSKIRKPTSVPAPLPPYLATPTIHTRFRKIGFVPAKIRNPASAPAPPARTSQPQQFTPASPKMASFRQNPKTHLRPRSTPAPTSQPQQSTPASAKLASFRQNPKTPPPSLPPLPPPPCNPNNPHPLARNWFRSGKIRKSRLRPPPNHRTRRRLPARTPPQTSRKTASGRDPKPPQIA